MSIIWAVPLLAVVIGGYLLFQRFEVVGPSITITFQDGDGIRPDQTPVRYRGVQVGIVRSVTISPDHREVEVEARLDRSAEGLACKGSQFWIVRPEVSAAGLQGLQTIVSGSFIQVEPGSGPELKKFAGIDKAPLPEKLRDGLELVLTSHHVGTLNDGAPVYHRGLEVGSVESLALNDDATAVNVHVRIQRQYADLVRQNTVFWNAGGLDVSLKLFGINVSAESMRSLIVGGIAFATPSPPGGVVASNTVFALQDKLEEKWLKWETPIPGWAGRAGPPTNNLPNSAWPGVGFLATNSTK